MSAVHTEASRGLYYASEPQLKDDGQKTWITRSANVVVDTLAAGVVKGGQNGIFTSTKLLGTTQIDTGTALTKGTAADGIHADTSGSGVITINTGGTTTGGDDGIQADQSRIQGAKDVLARGLRLPVDIREMSLDTGDPRTESLHRILHDEGQVIGHQVAAVGVRVGMEQDLHGFLKS